MKGSDRNVAEYTPLELISQISVQPQKRIQFLIELHRRLSMPALCLIIIFLGPSLALMAGKTGKLGGLTIGLVIFAAYYMVMIYGENLARSGSLPHYIGAWLSFVLLATFSIFAFERANRQ
jgi:lipopolysaccharide export LptBFGC system permease protein LptF